MQWINPFQKILKKKYLPLIIQFQCNQNTNGQFIIKKIKDPIVLNQLMKAQVEKDM